MLYTYTPKRLVAGSALTGALATYYTAASAYGAIVKELVFINTDGVAHQVTAHIIPLAGSAGVPTKIFDELLQPGQRWVDSCSAVVPLGSFIQASAAAGAVVTFNASGLEIS